MQYIQLLCSESPHKQTLLDIGIFCLSAAALMLLRKWAIAKYQKYKCKSKANIEQEEACFKEEKKKERVEEWEKGKDCWDKSVGG